MPKGELSTSVEFVKSITKAWQKGIESIIETGQLLIQAKDELPHGQFTKMIEKDLPFGDYTARRLMTIAKNRIILKRSHASVLPPSWDTLYKLSKLPDDELEALINQGKITPDITRKEVLALTDQRPKDDEEEEEGDEDEEEEEAHAGAQSSLPRRPRRSTREEKEEDEIEDDAAHQKKVQFWNLCHFFHNLESAGTVFVTPKATAEYCKEVKENLQEFKEDFGPDGASELLTSCLNLQKSIPVIIKALKEIKDA